MNAPLNFIRPVAVNHDQKLTEEVAMVNLLDMALVKAEEAKSADRYKDRPKSLGAGRVGHPKAPVVWDRGCERALWFEYKQYPSERPFPAKLYRIFAMGHAAEPIMVENLRAAGFTVVTHDDQGNQYGFAIARDPETGHARYKGFCDGIITAGPAVLGGDKGTPLKYPMLWENKAVNNKKWEKFKEVGVERSHPQYYGQLMQYENFLTLYQNPALLTMLNRDTGEVWVEFSRFNQMHTQAIIDRASRIIGAAGPLVLERAADDYEKLPCKWCDFRETCKTAELNRPTANNSVQAAPTWLHSDKM